MATENTPQAKAKTPAKTEPKAKKLRPCRCGCKQQVSGTFKPGHDARYASNLKVAVRDGKMSRVDALAKAGEVSPAFLSKVTRSLDLLAEAQVRAAKKAEDAKAVKPEPNGKAA